MFRFYLLHTFCKYFVNLKLLFTWYKMVAAAVLDLNMIKPKCCCPVTGKQFVELQPGQCL